MISWPPHTIYLDTPKGEGRVLFVLDRGPDSDLEWYCVDAAGEVWATLNHNVRVVRNITYGVRVGQNN